MSLPFGKNDKRTCRCFICGLEHTEYEAMKQHIIGNHEEGREYILCPLERCGSPVRDIKSHFAAKHKDTPMPKKGQMKAMVWKDQSGKKIKKPEFRQGDMISVKNGGKELHYRSAFECKVYETLEQINEVQSYHVEPIKVPYFFNGESHHYLPDLVVKFQDGRTEVWEVKPSSQTDLPVNQAKWVAAEQYCTLRGWHFTVITEVGLNKLKKIVRERRRLLKENSDI